MKRLALLTMALSLLVPAAFAATASATTTGTIYCSITTETPVTVVFAGPSSKAAALHTLCRSFAGGYGSGGTVSYGLSYKTGQVKRCSFGFYDYDGIIIVVQAPRYNLIATLTCRMYSGSKFADLVFPVK